MRVILSGFMRRHVSHPMGGPRLVVGCYRLVLILGHCGPFNGLDGYIRNRPELP
jgi:hypothetical protein